jgi:hypothetical protein
VVFVDPGSLPLRLPGVVAAVIERSRRRFPLANSECNSPRNQSLRKGSCPAKRATKHQCDGLQRWGVNREVDPLRRGFLEILGADRLEVAIRPPS